MSYTNNGDYYQTPYRDIAGVLALVAEAGDEARVERLSTLFENAALAPDLMQTQEKAFSLLAANALLADAGDVRIETPLEGGQGDSAVRAYHLSEEDVAGAPSFRNAGDGPVWRTVTLSGAPKEAPEAASSQFALTKQMFSTRGEAVSLSNRATV